MTNSTKERGRFWLQRRVSQHILCTVHRESALGAVRYESLRKLNFRQFKELKDRNLRGENFDKMVDELVMAKEKIITDK